MTSEEGNLTIIRRMPWFGKMGCLMPVSYTHLASGDIDGTLTASSAPIDTAATPSIDTDLEAAKTANVGDAVTFTVAASTTDEGTLSYQWYKDDVAIDGATEASYTISAAADTDAGSYKVVVTNTNGTATATATSAVCVLTVEASVVSENILSGISFTSDIDDGDCAYWSYFSNPCLLYTSIYLKIFQ